MNDAESKHVDKTPYDCSTNLLIYIRDSNNISSQFSTLTQLSSWKEILERASKKVEEYDVAVP
jgi:hypothetical protein